MPTKNIIIALVLIILVGFGGWWIFKSTNKSVTTESSQNQTEAQPEASTPEEASKIACKNNFDQNNFKNVRVETKNQFVTLSVRNLGDIKISLNDQAAPKTVENFLKLANAGFYDCLTFHRVAKGFVIQGGDPQGTGQGGPGYTVPAEIGLDHKTGSIAMARLPDQLNPKKESSGSQFYIAVRDLPELDGNYTVFGQVVSGMDIVQKINNLPTDPPGDGAPMEEVVIEKVIISSK